MLKLTCAFFLLLLLAPAVSFAGDTLTAGQILDKMEEKLNGYADQFMDVTLVIHDTDGKTKSYDMKIYQKGEIKRLVYFTSGEMKGMATLVEGPNNVHVYLPGFKKVRRVAAHNMNQSVVGSDLSNEDFATASWKISYDVKLDHEDEGSYYLLCTPKKTAEVSYLKVILRVDRKTFLQTGTDYFNAKGEIIKKMVGGEAKDFHGVLFNSKITFSDPITKHFTDLQLNDFKVNQGFKEEMFTVRNLQMGMK